MPNRISKSGFLLEHANVITCRRIVHSGAAQCAVNRRQCGASLALWFEVSAWPCDGTRWEMGGRQTVICAVDVIEGGSAGQQASCHTRWWATSNKARECHLAALQARPLLTTSTHLLCRSRARPPGRHRGLRTSWCTTSRLAGP
jgi:hypothetical protein